MAFNDESTCFLSCFACFEVRGDATDIFSAKSAARLCLSHPSPFVHRTRNQRHQRFQRPQRSSQATLWFGDPLLQPFQVLDISAQSRHDPRHPRTCRTPSQLSLQPNRSQQQFKRKKHALQTFSVSFMLIHSAEMRSSSPTPPPWHSAVRLPSALPSSQCGTPALSCSGTAPFWKICVSQVATR